MHLPVFSPVRWYCTPHKDHKENAGIYIHYIICSTLLTDNNYFLHSPRQAMLPTTNKMLELQILKLKVRNIIIIQ